MASYGRMYTLLLLVCIATLDAAAGVLDEKSRFRGQAVLSAALAAGLLTHNWFIFFLCGVAAWACAEHGRKALRLLKPAAAGVAVYAVLWGPAAIAQLTARSQQLAWLRKPGAVALADAVLAQLWLPAIALPVWLIAVALQKKTLVPRNSAWVGALACVLLPWLVSQWRPLYNVRFTIIAAPFIAWALASLASRAMVFSAALVVLGAGWPLWEAAREPVCSSQSAARILAEEARPGDTVIFCRLTRKPVEWYWPGGGVSRVSFPPSIDAHPGYEGMLTSEALEVQAAAIARHATGRVFVLADSAAAPSRALLNALSALRGEPSPPRLACPGASKHYFDKLLVFDAATTRAESKAAAPRE